MFSGGIGSWAAARRVRETLDPARLVLLFADTTIEDDDLYRFLPEAAANVGGELVVLRDGRTPWEVFHDTRFLGNARLARCSHDLKQKPARAWVEANCDPRTTVLYVGIAWDEAHRLVGCRAGWAPWRVEAPLTEPPWATREGTLVALAAHGIRPPRLYELSFPHNNCGGFCVRAGQAQFRKLLEVFPDRYRQHEAEEADLRAYLDKDVAILRDRRGGQTKPLTLRDFRARLEGGEACDAFDWGGCGCFVSDDAAPPAPSLP